MKRRIISATLALCTAVTILFAGGSSDCFADDGMNMYKNSDFIEKEQPELTEETKALISAYQAQPTEENYVNLRSIVIDNYNAVLDRKEAKLTELKSETEGKPGGDELVAEMEEIVQEMYVTYWDRINSSMLRFTDSRLLKWKTSDAKKYDYIPVMGAGESVYVKRTTVTNKEYAEFLSETGAQAPSDWVNGAYKNGEEDFPVVFVSYNDAASFCEWLSAKDGKNTYRLPNEGEWELAAGHMPKDADFNCGVNDGRTPVDQYSDVTRGAHGAVDFWGNVWEWTSTVRFEDEGTTNLGVKGGSWSSDRTDCRTEYRLESRNASTGYADVGFRVIKVLGGKEPEKKAELISLDAPVVNYVCPSDFSVKLYWEPVANAMEYQIFSYDSVSGLVEMLTTVESTSYTADSLEKGKTYGFIVQPISFTATADNVSSEYVTYIKCEKSSDTATMELLNFNGMEYYLYTPENAGDDMPLVVFLHGKLSGTGAEDFIEAEGFAKWLCDGSLGDVHAYVLFPLLPSNKKGWTGERSEVAGLIGSVVTQYGIDRDNISLTGFSMGGVGVWELAATYPDMFARIAPCSGSVRTNARNLSVFSKIAVRAFVGSQDTIVNPQSTINFFAKLTRTNPQASLTEFEGAGHTDVPSLAFLDDSVGLMSWLVGN